MGARIVTLLTDFGQAAPYVASMKGVLLAINPELTLVDLSHQVPPHNVRHAAYLLAEASRWFPPETIHVAVVDPGVGTSRQVVYARAGDQHYIAPDNGLLSRVALRGPLHQTVAVTEPAFRLAEVSKTFHGRDIMAPAAAHLSLGVAPERLGPPLDVLVMLDEPEPRREARRIVGQVAWVDSFGNLVANIDASALDDVPRGAKPMVDCAGESVAAIVGTYGEAEIGSLVVLIGSSGRLELAVVNGSAAERLGVAAGAAVTVRW